MDLQQCIELAPRALQPGLTLELEALQAAADSAHEVAQAVAAAAHAAGFTDHATVQIQEEVEDPVEASQVCSMLWCIDVSCRAQQEPSRCIPCFGACLCVCEGSSNERNKGCWEARSMIINAQHLATHLFTKDWSV